MTAPLRPVRVTVRPTRAGTVLLVGAGLAVIGAAWDSGIGLVVLALLLLTFNAVAAFAVWRNTRDVRILTPAPVTAFASERFTFDVTLRNLASRATSFDLAMSPGGNPNHVPLGAFVPEVAAGDAVDSGVSHRAMARGVYGQGVLEVWSLFPLGLWRCAIRFTLPNRVVVLPRLGTIRALPPDRRKRRGAAGVGASGSGDEQELWGVREWRQGESLRAVHWKLSARRGRLLAHEFRSAPRPAVHVLLDTAIPKDSRPWRSLFEDAVSLAATLVEHQVRLGHPVRLSIAGGDAVEVDCRRGPRGVVSALRALATVRPRAAAAPMPAPPQRRGERTFLVCLGAPPGFAAAREDVDVFDVASERTSEVFDRHRRRHNGMLLGVRV